MARRLGSNQRAMLAALVRHSGVWHPGSGWIWTSVSQTVRLLESLERRGLVERKAPRHFWITADGRRAVS